MALDLESFSTRSPLFLVLRFAPLADQCLMMSPSAGLTLGDQILLLPSRFRTRSCPTSKDTHAIDIGAASMINVWHAIQHDVAAYPLYTKTTDIVFSKERVV